MPQNLDRYLDRGSAAELTGIGKRTMDRLRREGGGPAYIRAGARRILYDRADLERWLADQTFPDNAAEKARTMPLTKRNTEVAQ